MLLARGEGEDQSEALALLDQAVRAAEALGMKRLEQQCARLRLTVSSPRNGDLAHSADTAGSQQSRFHREGEYWSLAYDGKSVRLRDSKGLHYIAHLLRYPGDEFHVADLAARVGLQEDSGVDPANAALLAREQSVAVGLGHAGSILDTQARTEYQRRLIDLQAELDESTCQNDLGRAARIREEIEFLTQELAAAYGLGGRARKAGDVGERVRKAVTNRIRDTLARIQSEHPPLGIHLAKSIRMGIFCSYASGKPTAWGL
jgi:hypothetical protein